MEKFLYKKTIKIFVLFFLLFTNSYSIENKIYYTVQIKKEKSLKIQKAMDLYQYQYDLNIVNETLYMLYKNSDFKFATKTIEMNLKLENRYNRYTTDSIETLLKLFNGVNPKNKRFIPYYNSKIDEGGGYIKYIKDKYERDFSIYLYNYPKDNLINNNFLLLQKEIKKELENLKVALKNEDNVKKPLKIIMGNLIKMLEEIKLETYNLRKEGVLKPFENYDVNKYCMPENWAQTDGDTTLVEILNFILYGDTVKIKGIKYNIYGIVDYYEKLYKNDLKPLIIHQ